MKQPLLIALLVVLAGCATTTPLSVTSEPGSVAGYATLASWGTFEMQLAPAYTRLAVLRHNAAAAVRRGHISVHEARHVQAEADRARALLDDAHRATAHGQATPGAQQRLGEALEIIGSIERGIAP